MVTAAALAAMVILGVTAGEGGVSWKREPPDMTVRPAMRTPLDPLGIAPALAPENKPLTQPVESEGKVTAAAAAAATMLLPLLMREIINPPTGAVSLLAAAALSLIVGLLLEPALLP
jgi:hypothetical protein